MSSFYTNECVMSYASHIHHVTGIFLSTFLSYRIVCIMSVFPCMCVRVRCLCVCVHMCMCVCLCVCFVLCVCSYISYTNEQSRGNISLGQHSHTHTHTHTHAHTLSLFLTVSVSHRVHTRRIRAFTRRATTSLSNVPKSMIKINFQWLSPVTIGRAIPHVCS